MPMLREVYGDGCGNNLSVLARDSDDMHELVYDLVLKPFLGYAEHIVCCYDRELL